MNEIIEVDCTKIKIGKRHRKEIGDLRPLAESITAVGLLQPIGITKNNELVFGERRLRAFQEMLKRETIPARIVEIERIIDGEYHENVLRKDFTPSERVAIADEMLERIGSRQGQRTDVELRDDCPEVEKGTRTREVAAERAGFGSDASYRRAKEVIEHGSAELIRKMDSGELSVHSAYKEIKRAEKIEKRNEEIEKLRKEIQSGDTSSLQGDYGVIVVDPPWPYEGKYDPGHWFGRTANPYPSMSLDEIRAIKLPAADDCILWLWTTHAFLPYSFEICESFGFRYACTLTWAKDRLGLGTWLRSKSEFCLMCVKGHPKVMLTNQSTVLYGKAREHSRKPSEFYAMVEDLCIGRKLDYFSREAREGWFAYGVETDKFSNVK